MLFAFVALYLKYEETNCMITLSCKVKEDFKQSIDIYQREKVKKKKKKKRGDPKHSSDNILGMSLNPKTNTMMSSTLVSLINEANTGDFHLNP